MLGSLGSASGLLGPLGVAPSPAVAATLTNWALATNGATASASSTYSPGYAAAAAINGDRTGSGWGSVGGWNASGPPPQWLEVDFASSKTLSELDVFTLQDNPGSPSIPTLAMTFSNYGITGFYLQYWDGSAWQTIPGTTVTGNNKVWRQLSITPVTTTKIRLQVTATTDGGVRLVELEAWG